MLEPLRLRRKEIETSGEELSLILKRKTLWSETKQAQGASSGIKQEREPPSEAQ